MGLDELLYLRFANTMLEPVWNRNYVECRADHHGRGLRRRGPRPLLRPGRRAARRRRQPPHAGGRRGRDGGARRRRPGDAQGRAGGGVPGDRRPPIRRTTCAASTRATSTSPGVAPDSTTETYAALRLDIDNWRWSGVPFFIRTGKHLPVTQTELRLVFKHPPRLGFRLTDAAAGAEPARHQARPVDRRPADRSTPSAPTTGGPEPIDLDMEFAEEGGEGPTPVRGAAARGDGRRQHPVHPPGRRRGDLADHAAAARRAAAGRSRTPRARGARRRPTRWSPGTAAGTSPGSGHDARRAADTAAQIRRARRRRRRSRRSPTTASCPTATRARWSRRTGRSTGCACPRSTRPASSAACSTGRPAASGSGRSASTIPTARAYEPGTNVLVTTWRTPTGWIVVRDALTMGPREREDEVTPHTRPPADDDADHMLVRPSECVDGHGRDGAGLRAGVRLRPRRRPSGRWSTAVVTPPTRPARARPFRLQTDLALGHRGRPRPRRGTCCRPASERYCALSWADEPGRARPTSTRPTPGSSDTIALLARLAGRRPRCPTTGGASRSSARR